MNIGVVGGSQCSRRVSAQARELGRRIGREGWVLICGGGPGVMEAVCRGARESGGLTVGILPGFDGKEANPFLDVKIPTGLGYVRNTLVVRAADVIIAVDGKYGTLSEIAFAFCEQKKVIGIGTWKIPGIIQVKSVNQAILKVKSFANTARRMSKKKRNNQ